MFSDCAGKTDVWDVTCQFCISFGHLDLLKADPGVIMYFVHQMSLLTKAKRPTFANLTSRIFFLAWPRPSWLVTVTNDCTLVMNGQNKNFNKISNGSKLVLNLVVSELHLLPIVMGKLYCYQSAMIWEIYVMFFQIV